MQGCVITFARLINTTFQEAETMTTFSTVQCAFSKVLTIYQL